MPVPCPPHPIPTLLDAPFFHSPSNLLCPGIGRPLTAPPNSPSPWVVDSPLPSVWICNAPSPTFKRRPVGGRGQSQPQANKHIVLASGKP